VPAQQFNFSIFLELFFQVENQIWTEKTGQLRTSEKETPLQEGILSTSSPGKK
jgi:hypothetical protein